MENLRLKLLYKLNPWRIGIGLFTIFPPVPGTQTPQRLSSPTVKFHDRVTGVRGWDLKKQVDILGTSWEACCVSVLYPVIWGEPRPPFLPQTGYFET